MLCSGGGSLGDRFANEEDEMFWIARNIVRLFVCVQAAVLCMIFKGVDFVF